MPDFPFERAKGAGWATGEILTSTQANTMDANAAAAADGSIWTDLTIARTWIGSREFTSDSNIVPVWNPVQRVWLVFGSSGGNPNCDRKAASFGQNLGNSQPSVAAGAGLAPLCAAANPAGIIVVGGTVNAATKIRESSDGDTFNVRSTTESGNNSVNSLIWHPGASLFVAGLSNAATTNIETSPDGQSWTQRAGLPNSHARGQMATNGTLVVVFPEAQTSTNKCLTSTDCVTWTERTLPTTQRWNGGVVYDTRYGRFLAFGDDHWAHSTDAIAWTDGGVLPIEGVLDMLGSAISGRVFVIGPILEQDFYAGYYDGSSIEFWPVVCAGNDSTRVAVGARQFVAVNSANDLHWTIAGGS